VLGEVVTTPRTRRSRCFRTPMSSAPFCSRSSRWRAAARARPRPAAWGPLNAWRALAART